MTRRALFLSISLVLTLTLAGVAQVRDSAMTMQADTTVVYLDSAALHSDSISAALDSAGVLDSTQLEKADTASWNWRKAEENLMEDLEEYSKRDNLVAKGLNELLVFEKKTEVKNPSTKAINPNEYQNAAYEPYKGKIIRNINVRVLKPFGPRVTDPDRPATSILTQGGNAVHINSRRAIIKNKLLFEKGEKVKPLRVSESERLLRQTRYILDARVYIDTVSGTDSVDMQVIVQDIWSISASASGDPTRPSGKFRIRDSNFLGLGREIQGKVFYRANSLQDFGYEGSYRVDNISDTYITGTLNYTDRNRVKSLGAAANHPFYSPTTTWAYGLNTVWTANNNPVLSDSDVLSSGIDNSVQDTYLARATKLHPSDDQNNLITGLRYVRSRFTRRPQREDLDLVYQGSDLYLTNLAYRYTRYYKENYIFGLGRTEDVPVGNIYSVTTGYLSGERESFPYIGGSIGYSEYFEHFGYIFASLEAGSFRRKNQWYNTVFSGELLHYTRLYPLGRWKFRGFFWNRLVYGYNTPPNSALTINDNQGIRGFSVPRIGNRKWVVNIELDFHTPITFFGFRTAFIAFADFAFINKNNGTLVQGTFYQGYGLGLRIRNEHLIFSTIQLGFSYYPNADLDNQKVYDFYDQSSNFFRFRNFDNALPSVVSF